MAGGMISAPQPEAVEAGALILKRGGNAVDAAIACALVQTVVDPQMSGIAGFGTMQVYLPKRGVHLNIDFHGRCPALARPDMWADIVEGETRDGFGFILKGRVNDVGYQSITVPGSLKAYAEAVAEFGTMDWKDVIQPAIDQARDGFMVRPHVYAMWMMNEEAYGRTNLVDKLRFSASGQQIYFHEDGRVKKPGERIKNPDMLRTLERIAQHGPDIFYRGEIADEIDADMRANGGLLRRQDLESYRTKRTEPLWGEYRGHRLATPQPPAGGVMVLEILNILENFDLGGLGHNSAEHIRLMAEAQKYATIDKDTKVGDPDFVQVPTAYLAGKEYAAELAAAIRSGKKAHVVRLNSNDPKNTTTISIVDKDKNAVTMTHTLGSPSGVITQGLGFMYNGSMAVFDPRPGRAGSIAPGKSRFTAMAPSIVFKGEDPYLVVGAPGGTHITLAIAQVISNVVDFGMTMLEAIVAPRISATSDIVDVSNRIPKFVTDEVERMGYPVARNYLSYAFAGVHGIKLDGAKLEGGADPQRDGMALAV